MRSIFVRAETFQNEYRRPLVPEHIQTLINAGLDVYVQSSSNRFFPDQAFLDISFCKVTPKSWTDPEFQDSFIVGIKELKNLSALRGHTHVYFSHALKDQQGAYEILTAFSNSHSKLYDYEYFTDGSGQRLIAFGWYAGVVGAALGMLEYNQRRKNEASLENLHPWSSLTHLVECLPDVGSPKIAVLGPNGRCGQGVCFLLDKLGQTYTSFPRGSSIKDLEDYNIVYNCILLEESYTQVWYSQATVFHRPTVIVDISCDYSKKNNPIQLYSVPTQWEHPVSKPHPLVSLIAIENLPSLLPVESSYHFSKQLVPLLLTYPNDVWTRALDVFNEKLPRAE